VQILIFPVENFGVTPAESGATGKFCSIQEMLLAKKTNKYIRDAHGIATAIP
jgi:hypothetical protein